MTTIRCIRCGDPCPILENGAVCGDCTIYAYWTGERWKVYLPCWLVPHQGDIWHECPNCFAERGQYLPTCPNCGSDDMPQPVTASTSRNPER